MKHDNFQALKPYDLKFNDELNESLRISNKLRDYDKIRALYFDLTRFQLYDEFLRLFKKKTPASQTKDVLYLFLYYEFKRAIIWNSIFLLSAEEFRQSIDVFRGKTLEEIRSEEGKRNELFQQLIQQNSIILPLQKNESEQAELKSLPKTHYPKGTLIQPLISTPALIREDNFYEFFSTSDVGKYVHQDLSEFIKKWEQGLRISKAFFLLDNHQILDEQGEKIISEIKQRSKKIISIKTIVRDSDGNLTGLFPIKRIGSASYELKPFAQGNARTIAQYLFYFNGFDKRLIEIVAKHLVIEWTKEDWEGLEKQEWIEPHLQNWFYIKQSQTVRDIINPISINKLSENCKKDILKYLNHYESGHDKGRLNEHTKMARLDGVIYGFSWFPEDTVSYWLNLWLIAIKESDFELAERLTMLGYHYESTIQLVLNSNSSFDDLFSSVINDIKERLKKPPRALTKGEKSKWLNRVKGFCRQGVDLTISGENQVLYLQAGRSLLANFSDYKELYERYLNFCESNKIKNAFSKKSQKLYLWFLIELYQKDVPHSNKIHKYLQEFADCHAENYKDWDKIAYVHYILDNLEESVDAAEEYLKFKPYDERMLTNLINCLTALERFEEAKKKIEEILSVDKCKNSLTFKLLKGDVLRTCGEKGEAQDWFETLLSDETLDTKTRASIWYKIEQVIPKDKYEEKENALKQALKLEPDYFNASSNLMNLYIQRDNVQKAKDILQTFSKDKPDDDLSRILLQVQFYLNTGSIDKGLQSLRLSQKDSNHEFLLFLEAIFYEKNKQYHEALNAVDRFLKARPDHVSALWLKLELQLQTKSDREIKTTIKELERISPVPEKNYTKIAKLYLQYGHFDEALAWLGKIKDDTVQNINFLEVKGSTLASLKRYKEAIKIYDQALEIQSDNSDLWIKKAEFHFDLGEYTESLKCCDKAISIYKKQRYPWFVKLLNLQALENNDNALQVCEEAIELYPKDQYFWIIKADLLHVLKRYDEALQVIEKVIKLNPKQPLAWTKKAKILNELSKYNEALQAIEKAAALAPLDIVALSTKISALVSLKRYDEALLISNETVRLDPQIPDLWDDKAYVLISLRRYDEALQLSEKTLAIAPIKPGGLASKSQFITVRFGGKKSDFWNTKGIILWCMRSFQESLEAINEALSLDADHTNSLKYKGALLMVLGHESESKKVFDHFLQVGGEKDEFYYTRACANAVLNQSNNALSDLQEAIALNEKWREEAKDEPDFDSLREMEVFQRLV